MENARNLIKPVTYAVINDRAYDLQNPSGHIKCASVADMQLLMPARYTVSISINMKGFGWACKYINDPLMPDLNWQHSSMENVQTLDKNINVIKHNYSLHHEINSSYKLDK